MSTKISKSKKKVNKEVAKGLAFIARNQLEDLHKKGEIDQELMKKINIRICQGIYEGLNLMLEDGKLFLDYATNSSRKWDDPKDKC